MEPLRQYFSHELLRRCDDAAVETTELDSATTFRGHQDYVGSGCFMQGQANNLLVGSYEETVRLWDPRGPASAMMTSKHNPAVEAVLCVPSGTTVVAAAENQIAILDVVAAGLCI